MKNKVVIVTGATSGMGKAIAENFSEKGFALVLSGRNEEKGKALHNQLSKTNEHTLFVAGDVSLPEVNEQLVQLAVENFGKLDIVVANAGVLGLGSVTEVPLDTWNKTIETNLNAIFYLCRFAIPEMQKTGGGNIIINSSIAAFKSFPNHPAYCASKAAAVALAKQMALDYGPAIRVNAICPGPVDTPMIWESAEAFDNPEKAVEDAGKNTLLKRLGKPEDIAELALFLASDKSAWMTGSCITIDGGITVK